MRFLLLALLLVSPLCFAKTVVVIESYHDAYQWDADYIAAIQSELGESHEIHVLALDTKRLPKSEWPQQAASVQERVAALQPDLAILGDDNAFSLMVGEPLIHSESPLRDLRAVAARRGSQPMAVALGKGRNAADAALRARPSGPSERSTLGVATF